MENKIRLSPKRILNKEFSIESKGYSANEVDSYLDIVKEDYLNFQSMLNDSYDEIERKVNKLYSDWPSLFNYNVKVTYLNESNFVRIHNMTDAVGITFGRENKDK